MYCTIGIDFGTLSARAIVVNTRDGAVLGEKVCEYPHGVMDSQLTCGVSLPPDWALQDPTDYLLTLEKTVKGALKEAGIQSDEVVGLSVDFTCCTLLPVDESLTPLCLHDAFKRNKHAYPKLWKHHAALRQAERISALAEARGEAFLGQYCGYISPEWAVPKILEIYEQAPEVCARAAWYLEAGDWITALLTGTLAHSSSFAAYKSLWNAESAFPHDAFFEALAPGFAAEVKKHTGVPVRPIGTKAGTLSNQYAALLGLREGISVGVPVGDAYATVIGNAVLKAGEMVIVLGTSACDILLAEERHTVAGIDSVIRGAIAPGLYAYEAGQFGAGDTLGWFVNTMVPREYVNEAAQKGEGVHELLTEKAARLAPGESGLIALEWFNGNRSILRNSALSGAVLGLTLTTRPEEIYRALIEATAFGQRMILDSFARSGLPVERIVLSGGIARKNRLLDQIYADVLGRVVFVSDNTQAGALGAAMYAAVAAGSAAGGWDSIAEACGQMACAPGRRIDPDARNRAAYEELFSRYRELHDYFGRSSRLMEALKAQRTGAGK